MILVDHVLHDLEHFATNLNTYLLCNVSSLHCPLHILQPGPPRKWKAGCLLYFDTDAAEERIQSGSMV
jgi:hypothetical protein